MKQNYTHIALVLDRSGSMESVKDDTIGGVNEFIKTQKAVPGAATFTLAQFDDIYEVLQECVDIKDAKDLTKETYVPRNSTALLDAIGKTIVDTGKRLKDMHEDQRPEKVVFVVVTDGHENASKEYSRTKIFDMIKHQRETYKWEFVFIGANQDAIDAGGQMGYAASHSLSSGPGGQAVAASYAATSSNMRSFRMGTKKDMSWEKEQREEQEKLGAHKSTTSTGTQP